MKDLTTLTLKELYIYNREQWELSDFGKAWKSSKCEKAYKEFKRSKELLKDITNKVSIREEINLHNTKVNQILFNH